MMANAHGKIDHRGRTYVQSTIDDEITIAQILWKSFQDGEMLHSQGNTVYRFEELRFPHNFFLRDLPFSE
jgi:hypothetical protein